MAHGTWWSTNRPRLLRLWAVGLAASLVVVGASALGYLEPIQAGALDLILRLQGSRFPTDVVVVAIDDEAFAALGRRQPIPRTHLAQVIHALQRAGAAVVGLDLDLTAPTSAADDAELVKAILEFSDDGLSRVVLTEDGGDGSGHLVDPAVRRASVRGSSEVPADADGVIRRAAFLVPRGTGPPEAAFSLAVVARLGGMDQIALERAVRESGSAWTLPRWQLAGTWESVGDPPLAFRPGELFRVTFAGPARSFLTIPSRVVAGLADSDAAIAPDNPFRGRIVLVGGTFQESREFYPTPHGSMSGVEVHANLAHMLTSRGFVQPTSWVVSLGFHLALVLGAGVVLVACRPLVGTLLSVTGGLLVGVTASSLAFHSGGFWVDFVLPLLTMCLMGLITETLARRRLRDSFSRYVSREVMAQILTDAPGLAGERREVSILFSDLRAFTALAESRPAEAVAAHLSEYFAAMTKAIFLHRGTINDFVGDAVMAMFGAPLDDPQHALHAARSAVAMQETLAGLNPRWEAAGLPTLRMGIGIHSGEVFAGNVGGPARLKYAVVGDSVNVAVRLESFNKKFGTRILMTEATRTILGARAEAKDCGTLRVNGRIQPLRVYELLALHPE